MRKVNLKVQARVMVPLILTYNVVATVEEDVVMANVALSAISGRSRKGISIEDSSFEITSVEGIDESEIDDDLTEQISNYIETNDIVVLSYQSHKVLDSR